MIKKIRVKMKDLPDGVLPRDMWINTRLGVFKMTTAVAPCVQQLFQRLEDLGYTPQTAADLLKGWDSRPLGAYRLSALAEGKIDVGLFTFLAHQLGCVLALKENPHHDENELRTSTQMVPLGKELEDRMENYARGIKAPYVKHRGSRRGRPPLR